MHSWSLDAHSFVQGLAAYGDYAVYVTTRALHALKLSEGADRVVVPTGGGWFFNGVSLQAPGAIAPYTTKRGKNFRETFRFLTTARLRAALG